MQDIALLSLNPNTKKQEIVLTGEAKNLNKVLDYVKKLESQEALTQVILQKHSIDEASNYKPVAFKVKAHWQQRQP